MAIQPGKPVRMVVVLQDRQHTLVFLFHLEHFLVAQIQRCYSEYPRVELIV